MGPTILLADWRETVEPAAELARCRDDTELLHCARLIHLQLHLTLCGCSRTPSPSLAQPYEHERLDGANLKPGLTHEMGRNLVEGRPRLFYAAPTFA